MTTSLCCTQLGAWDIIAAGMGPKGGQARRLPIALGAIAQSTILNDFPVLVRLTTASFPYASARSDGLDIRFMDADGTTPLAFERESWNPSSVSDFWVKIPSLAAAPAHTDIWIYFGDDSATDASNASAVWTDGYLAVLHGGYYDDTTTLERYYLNSAGLAEPSAKGALDPPGDMAGTAPFGSYGFAFTGANKMGLIFPFGADFTDLGPLTFEARLRDQGTAADRALFFKGTNKVAKLLLTVQAGETIRFSVDYTITPLTCDSDAGMYATGSWTSFALAWDGVSGVAMYSNGDSRSTTVSGGTGTPVPNGDEQLVIGNDDKPASSDREITADLDEIRISNTVRSPEWIRAQYLSQLGNQLTFGEVEVLKDVR